MSTLRHKQLASIKWCWSHSRTRIVVSHSQIICRKCKAPATNGRNSNILTYLRHRLCFGRHLMRSCGSGLAHCTETKKSHPIPSGIVSTEYVLCTLQYYQYLRISYLLYLCALTHSPTHKLPFVLVRMSFHVLPFDGGIVCVAFKRHIRLDGDDSRHLAAYIVLYTKSIHTTVHRTLCRYCT